MEICDGGFPLSTDSVALAGFVKLPKSASVLDLGSGCGTLGLLLCADRPDCSVTGIELNEKAHETALVNASANKIADRLTSICKDLRSIPEFSAPGAFHVCVSNPPYFTGGYKSAASQARHTDTCTTSDLFASADWALRYGGDFFLVHKPGYLAELCYQASLHHLTPKRLMLLRHKADGPVNLILLQCRKGGKPGLTIEEAALYEASGAPTAYYQALYHL